jgi:hypothetical protein
VTSAAPPPAPPAAMREYRCGQGHYLFSSDASWGRVRHHCRKCRRDVTVYLGGYQPAGGGAGAGEVAAGAPAPTGADRDPAPQ